MVVITWFTGKIGNRDRRLVVGGGTFAIEAKSVDALGETSWQFSVGGGDPAKERILERALVTLARKGGAPSAPTTYVAIGTYYDGTWFEGDHR